MTMTTGMAVMHLLKSYGVDTVFGMPGVHTLEFYRALEATNIRHIGVRHEQGAGFMADGYARVSGKPGVCLLISGPGVTNAATPIGQAYSDSIPMLVLTSVAKIDDLGMGRGRLHEIRDQRAVTAPLTAFSEIATTPRQVQELVHRAFAVFASQRPRPCHISVPLDVLEMPWPGETTARSLPVHPLPDDRAMDRAAGMIAAASHPVMIVGGGAIEAADAVRRLAERSGAAVIPTIAGKGILPADHPQSLEMTLDSPGTQAFIAEADLVLAVGTELAEPDVWLADALPMSGKFLRIDLDPEVLVRDYKADVAMLADARATLEGILERLEGANMGAGYDKAALDGARRAGRAEFGDLEKMHLPLLDAIRAGVPQDGFVFTDMTQIAYTGYAVFPANRPRQWFFPAGYGTLGFALPAAIGAQLATPERPGAVLIGDGGFQFTLPELATAVEQKLPLAIILWNNESLKQIARFMAAGGIPEIGVHPKNPDFAALGRAYHAHVAEPTSLAELTAAMEAAYKADGPTLIVVNEFSDWVQNAS
jgi:5-guanidino-2-oxopentanoate decarboxylase